MYGVGPFFCIQEWFGLVIDKVKLPPAKPVVYWVSASRRH